MTGLSRSLLTMALTGTALVACGARTGLDVIGVAPRGSAIASDAGEEVASDGPTFGDVVLVDQSAESGTCVGPEIPLQLQAPNLYFVLDHSTSMLQESKWTNIRQVVSQLMTQIGAGARFGAAMFPGVSTPSSCAPGVEVMSLRQGDSQGVTANAFFAATTAQPNGGTPTAATLEALLPRLSGLAGPTFAILATDGGPNCNAALTCSVDECTSNIDGVPGCPAGGPTNCCQPAGAGLACLDGARVTQAAADLAAAGVQTFVMGIPGSGPYGAVLDQIAKTGGTARPSEPLYYEVNGSDVASLAAALGQIAARTGAGCTFTLSTPATQPATAQVTVDGMAVPAGDSDGWSLSGRTLTLFGATCSTARASGAVLVRLLDGCSG
jgi:hypothetical protein